MRPINNIALAYPRFMLVVNRAMSIDLEPMWSIFVLALTPRDAMPNCIGVALTCLPFILNIIGVAPKLLGVTLSAYDSIIFAS